MTAKDAKIHDDYDNDILYLYIDEKVKNSLQIENFVIDNRTKVTSV